MGNLRCYAFPEVVSANLAEGGYGLLSLGLKLILMSPRHFDVAHADVGHRPSSGWPCRLNRWLRGAVFVSEWWDNYGPEGQLAHRQSPRTVAGRALQRHEVWSEIEIRKHADGVVVLSEAGRQRALGIGISAERLAIIHGGAETQHITYRESGPRSIPGLSADSLVFGFIGMTPGDLDDLSPFFRAFTSLQGSLRLKLVTCGNPLSTPARAATGIGDSLVELGWINYRDEAHKLWDVDVFVLVKEDNIKNCAGWPNKLGDYLAFGRPVLANPYGDVAAFMDRYPNGFYRVQRSAEAIRSAIRSIHQDGVDRRRAMGRLNRELAERVVSWNAKARELEDFYHRILDSGVRGPQ